MLQLAKNIRLIRQVMKLTQPKFGDLFGATKGMIISYELAVASPNELFVKRLSQLSGVPHADLLDTELTEADIKIDLVKKDKNVNRGTLLETQQGQGVTPKAIKKPDPIQVISGLVEANKTHADANKKHADTINRLVGLLEKVNSGSSVKVSSPGQATKKGNLKKVLKLPFSDKKK